MSPEAQARKILIEKHTLQSLARAKRKAEPAVRLDLRLHPALVDTFDAAAAAVGETLDGWCERVLRRAVGQ
jgi:hypothetical protein